MESDKKNNGIGIDMTAIEDQAENDIIHRRKTRIFEPFRQHLKKKNRSPDTIQGYIRMLEMDGNMKDNKIGGWYWYITMHKGKQFKDATFRDYLDFQTAIEDHTRKEFIARSYAKKFLTPIVAYYKFKSIHTQKAKYANLYSKIRSAGTIEDTAAKKKKKALKFDELIKMNTAAIELGSLEKAVFAYFVYTGGRAQTIAVKIEEIDWSRDEFPDGNIHLKVKGQHGGKYIDVPLHPKLRTILLEWLSMPENLKRCEGRKRIDGYLIPTNGHIFPHTADPYVIDQDIAFKNREKNRETARRIIDKISKKAKIPRVHPHLLRNTSITRSIDSGLDAATMQNIVGHTDVKVTKHYDTDPAVRAAQAFREIDILHNPDTDKNIPVQSGDLRKNLQAAGLNHDQMNAIINMVKAFGGSVNGDH